MAKNVMNIEENGHTYKVLPIEGSDGEYVVIKDGVTTKRIKHDELFINDELIDIEEWWNMV